MNILVLEDESILAQYFGDALTEAGHAVTVVYDNESATRALLDQPFDLVIADLMIGSETCLPTLDCARCFRPEAEIILVTGSSLFPHGELHYSISNVAYRVQKPVLAEDLAALAAHCGRTSRRDRVPG